MECTTCGPSSTRVDKPHTFFAHAPSKCPGCDDFVEARIVVRDGAVVALKFCAKCGASEEPVSDDAEAYVAAFVARGEVPSGLVGDHVFKQTTSTCPSCLALLLVDVVIREGKVFFKKDCPACGPSEALVSEDANYYVRAYAFARAGTEPHSFATEVEHGCPTDCGTCGDHEQHTCLPIIEVTDHCNLECPICIVDNHDAHHLSLEQFTRMIDRMVESEGDCESVALSGGEPTSHPQFFDLVRIASRPEIGRVAVITNGLRLARDRGFAEAFKASGAYCVLQLDGFTADTHEKLRGKDLCKDKEAALAILKQLQIPTQLVFVATRGVNEHQIGRAVDLLLSEDHILSLNFQPVAFTGSGGGRFAHDPMDRLTIPGVIAAVEAQTNGTLVKHDFSPLPCSHPQCVSLTYLLRLDDGSFVPFARFVDFTKHGSLLRSSATLGASPEIHDVLKDVIYDVFARVDEIPRGPEILKALRRSVDVMFPSSSGQALTRQEAVRVGELQAKSIFLHHYMDRHDFDLERLRKCCHHYPQVDGRVMPACGFNLFHRGAAKGPDTQIAAWGKKPWTTDAPTLPTAAMGAEVRHALHGIAPGERVGTTSHGAPPDARRRLPLVGA